MSEAERLNQILVQHAPAAGRCLSPLGRRAAFPKGIPYQTAAARSTEINATIGQVTDGRGQPLPLPAMQAACEGLDQRMAFLYAPQEGHLAVRQAWLARQRALAAEPELPVSTPMVVNGLSQGISLVADAFADEETAVVVPDPCWENYHLIFTLRSNAKLVPYPFYRDGRFDVHGLAQALEQVRGRKAVVLVNFPSNPTGYTPTQAEADQIVEVLLAHPGPAVVVFDDAYQGLVWESDRVTKSLFWEVARRHDPERLFPIKVDGATKEMLFFGGRVGFIGSSATGPAEEALLSKLKCIARATTGVCAGPSQALVLAALQDPGLDAAIADRKALLAHRYRLLKEAIGGMRSEVLRPYPFNSGVFALIGVEGVDAEALRERLIADESVGVIALPDTNALRVAYCSVDAGVLPELVTRLERAARAAV